MAIKFFQNLFSRRNRGPIVLTPEEAYAPIAEETPAVPAQEKPTEAADPVEAERKTAEEAPSEPPKAQEEPPAAPEDAREAVPEAPTETAQPMEAEPEPEQDQPATETQAPEIPVEKAAEETPTETTPEEAPQTMPEEVPPLVMWVYACLDDPLSAKALMRPQMIAQFRAITEDDDGFTGRLPSGACARARVHSDVSYVSEQSGYLKTQFKDTFLTDRDVQNAAMMQIELFNAQVEFTLESPDSPRDESAFLRAIYAVAQPMRGYVVNAAMEIARWDKRLVISPDGRTDFSVFMPIRRGAAQYMRVETAAADEARKKRSVEVLKRHGVDCPFDIPVQAREAEAKLRTPEEIVDRLAALFACALKAQAYTSPKDVVAPAAWSLNAIKRLDGQYGVNRLFTGKEAEYVVRALDAQHEAFLLRFEACAVLLWALGLHNPGWPDERADASAIMRVIRDADTEMLLRIAKPRPLGEILNMHDIIFRLHTLIVREGEAALGQTKVDHDVVYERHYALNWLVAVDGISDWDLVVPKT